MSILAALDIETKCNVQECTGACSHALDPYTSVITCVGLYYEQGGRSHAVVFRNLNSFSSHIKAVGQFQFVGHNLKFDLKHLRHKGVKISTDTWVHDTQLMAGASSEKVSQEYLEWYESKRKKENTKLTKGYSHREAGMHSLKTLAPYFLEVSPFWENPEDHDNDDYVLSDCKYTYKLYEFFIQLLHKQGTYKFYEDSLMPWTKRLLAAEIRGIKIDVEKCEQTAQTAQKDKEKVLEQLDLLWEPAYKKYQEKELLKLKNKYHKMYEKNKETCKKDRKSYYDDLLSAAALKVANKVNFNSPKQLTWLIRDYLKLDIKDFWDKESTDKGVLNKLASQGREDIKLLLQYRKLTKKLEYLAVYKDRERDGIIHCNFNPTGTRTGRLSSSEPNMQQVSKDGLRELFTARQGYKLITYDMSRIEAVLIAYYTKDPILLDIVINKQDFHGYNANIYFGLDCPINEVKDKYPKERAFAKQLGYALFYGAGVGRIGVTASEHGYQWSTGRCREVHENFKETYKQVLSFKKGLDRTAVNSPITNLFGRQHQFSDPTEIFMKNFNKLIQGSASDMVWKSADNIKAEFDKNKIDGHILLLVHDEIVAEVEENKTNEASIIMEKCMTWHRLDTGMGAIQLEVEGGVSDVWEK